MEFKATNSDDLILIDDADIWIIKDHRWFIVPKGKNKYVRTTICEDRGMGRKSYGVYLHKILCPTAVETVDHINGNTLDNRRNNLRPATKQQQRFNETPREGGVSRYKGVSYFPWGQRARRWRATIKINCQQRTIGYFFTEEEAAKAYNKKAKELFGEYARLNDDVVPQDIWEANNAIRE